MKRKKRKKRSGSSRSRVTVEELYELAAQPVPLGSGARELGRGRHAYVKINRLDGSVLCLRFGTREAMERAMALGVAADAARDDDYLGAA